ncbi:hypothetical protein IEO70_04075 [Bacillus sp. AGMB 02131]|uniref:Uncharacterized protein n=1 Tax=Peribacillus faecalis TaxID=2772559 RepID=A0A927CY89_9BACI|nr:hypothetical protein [Peribacillus faecalis]MBD3107534.1 hypothetical protein [Peribacillus faecalis]
MKKSLYLFIWVLVAIVINMGAFPVAMFSLFGTPEGTSIFSLDYLIAFIIVFLANIVTIQIFVAMRKNNKTVFLSGVAFAILESLAFVLFITTGAGFGICVALALISVIGASVLLVKN